MLGQMMSHPLLVSSVLVHADRHHRDVEVISRRVEGDLHRLTYRELHTRARRLARGLEKLGIQRGERVATIAWNGHRHLEVYFAVSGSGAVLHTVNPRLHPDQVAWLLSHAEDRVVFFDRTFLPIVEAVAARAPTVQHWILLADEGQLPAETQIPGLMSYESVLGDDDYRWPELDERAASSLCYTSGTTGNPRGVLYSHRSTVLHALAAALPDSLNLSSRDTLLPVVPMFHVNAWGLVYAAPMVGARLVFPGPHLDGKSLHTLFEEERVTVSAGVPTVWQGLLGHVEQHGLRFSTMRRTVIGGSACPPAMLRAFQERHDVQVIHAWGMTETSPVGTVSTLKGKHVDAPADTRFALATKQGRVVFGVDMKIVGADGAELPWDGRTPGDLLVRGPWVVESYFREEGASPLRDGWFPTGDVATIDADGYMQITDRTKDVIKSGGEWISSIELENIAMAHPGVQMAACLGVKHPKWDERPVLVVVRRPGAELTREALIEHYDGKVARWQVPDDVVFVESIPLGATGKMLKTRLRETLAGYLLPDLR